MRAQSACRPGGKRGETPVPQELPRALASSHLLQAGLVILEVGITPRSTGLV